MNEHERHAENLGAYALGALDEATAAELERHLAGCPHCARELRALERARDVLPASLPPVAPPRALKRRLMSEVAADAKGQRRPARSWRPRWALPAAGGVAAASALAVVLAIALSGPAETVIDAEPTASAPAGVAAALEREGEEGTLVVQRLPELGRGRAYQLWIQRGGTMEPSSVFTLEPDGTAIAPVEGSLDGASSIVLTREPLTGSTAPTTAPLLEVRLDA